MARRSGDGEARVARSSEAGGCGSRCGSGEPRRSRLDSAASGGATTGAPRSLSRPKPSGGVGGGGCCSSTLATSASTTACAVPFAVAGAATSRGCTGGDTRLNGGAAGAGIGTRRGCGCGCGCGAGGGALTRAPAPPDAATGGAPRAVAYADTAETARLAQSLRLMPASTSPKWCSAARGASSAFARGWLLRETRPPRASGGSGCLRAGASRPPREVRAPRGGGAVPDRCRALPPPPPSSSAGATRARRGRDSPPLLTRPRRSPYESRASRRAACDNCDAARLNVVAPPSDMLQAEKDWSRPLRKLGSPSAGGGIAASSRAAQPHCCTALLRRIARSRATHQCTNAIAPGAERCVRLAVARPTGAASGAQGAARAAWGNAPLAHERGRWSPLSRAAGRGTALPYAAWEADGAVVCPREAHLPPPHAHAAALTAHFSRVWARVERSDGASIARACVCARVRAPLRRPQSEASRKARSERACGVTACACGSAAAAAADA